MVYDGACLREVFIELGMIGLIVKILLWTIIKIHIFN